MRITLDIDNSKERIFHEKALLLKLAFPTCKVRYRTSSSGKGGHVEILNAPVDELTAYNIRKLLGDHEKRIAIDLSRPRTTMLPQQVLFDFKLIDGKIKRAGEWKYI